MSVIITVAPTGPIASTADNATLPTQPLEIAEAVHAATLEGASVGRAHDLPIAAPDQAEQILALPGR